MLSLHGILFMYRRRVRPNHYYYPGGDMEQFNKTLRHMDFFFGPCQFMLYAAIFFTVFMLHQAQVQKDKEFVVDPSNLCIVDREDKTHLYYSCKDGIEIKIKVSSNA